MSARGPPPDWLSFLAGLRPAHNDRADRPILRWQACRGQVNVKCSSRYSACPSSPARRHPPAPPTPTGCSSRYPGTPLPLRCGCRRNPVRLPLRYSRGSAAEPNCNAPEPECLPVLAMRTADGPPAGLSAGALGAGEMAQAKRDGGLTQGDRRSKIRRRNSSSQTRRLNSAYTTSAHISKAIVRNQLPVPQPLAVHVTADCCDLLDGVLLADLVTARELLHVPVKMLWWQLGYLFRLSREVKAFCRSLTGWLEEQRLPDRCLVTHPRDDTRHH